VVLLGIFLNIYLHLTAEFAEAVQT
jgi:hypothetical protein